MSVLKLSSRKPSKINVCGCVMPVSHTYTTSARSYHDSPSRIGHNSLVGTDKVRSQCYCVCDKRIHTTHRKTCISLSTATEVCYWLDIFYNLICVKSTTFQKMALLLSSDKSMKPSLLGLSNGTNQLSFDERRGSF